MAQCCRALAVSPSGFYAWQERPASARTMRDGQLRVQIRASHGASRGRYGRPRVWKDLYEAGERVSEKRVGRLMREEGLRARVRKRFRSTTMSEHDQPVAANVLARQFDGHDQAASGPQPEAQLRLRAMERLEPMLEITEADAARGRQCL